jgi:hypothetical protein
VPIARGRFSVDNSFSLREIFYLTFGLREFSLDFTVGLKDFIFRTLPFACGRFYVDIISLARARFSVYITFGLREVL